jgi:HIV Tat-specific factor 1
MGQGGDPETHVHFEGAGGEQTTARKKSSDSQQEDPAAMLEIKEDIRDECAKLGAVTNVVLFDQEKDGVASVRFSDAEAAAACVRVLFSLMHSDVANVEQLMNGRWFDERQLEAYIATGNEKFSKSNDKKVGFDEDEDEEEGGRLDNFGSWLEQED